MQCMILYQIIVHCIIIWYHLIFIQLKPKFIRKEYTILAIFNRTIFQKNRIIYKNLYATIIRQNLSIPVLACEMKIDPSTLKNKFFGKEVISLKEACRIAKILKSDIHYLFQELVP